MQKQKHNASSAVPLTSKCLLETSSLINHPKGFTKSAVTSFTNPEAVSESTSDSTNYNIQVMSISKMKQVLYTLSFVKLKSKSLLID